MHIATEAAMHEAVLTGLLQYMGARRYDRRFISRYKIRINGYLFVGYFFWKSALYGIWTRSFFSNWHCHIWIAACDHARIGPPGISKPAKLV